MQLRLFKAAVTLLLAVVFTGDAFGFMRGGLGTSIQSPLVKPNGTPTLNSGNALGATIAFLGVDTGTGAIATLAGPTVSQLCPASLSHNCSDGSGHNVAPGGALPLPPTTATAYGSGMQWAGSGMDLQTYGAYASADPTTAINNVMNLANQGTGAGYTIFAVFIQNATSNDGSFVAGRPSHAGEATPFSNSDFSYPGSGSGDLNTFTGYILNNSTGHGDGTAVALGSYQDTAAQLIVAVMTFKNTSAGVSTGTLYINGTQIGSPTTGLSIVPSNYSGFGQDDESQIMMGCIFHVQTGINYNCLNGWVFMLGIANTGWSAAQVASFSAAPYQIVNY